jgi:predicted RNase H-like nuclease
MSCVLGVDGARLGSVQGWLVCRLAEDTSPALSFVEELTEALDANPAAEAVAVDVPIGHEDPHGDADGRRRADVRARDLLGDKAASVFPVPPPDVMAAETYEAAVDRARQRDTIAPSRQAWALADRIREVREVATGDPRLVEAHPELAFQAMAGTHDPDLAIGSKRSWRGRWARLSLLSAAGIELPREAGEAGRARAHDVVDAAACAWVAQRVRREAARTVPTDPPTDPRTGRAVAIHV